MQVFKILQYLFIALSVAFLFSSPTNAQNVLGTVTAVEELYVHVSQPRVETVCETFYSYTQRQPNPGNLLGGAIIGGILGNQLSNNSNRDVSTLLGAIIGGSAGASIGTTRTHTNQTQVCNNYVVSDQVVLRDGYRIYYILNGYSYSFYSSVQYSVGDRILTHR